MLESNLLNKLLPQDFVTREVETRRRTRLIVYAVAIALAAVVGASISLAIFDRLPVALSVLALAIPLVLVYAVMRFTQSVDYAAYLFMFVITGAVVVNFGGETDYSVLATIVLPLAAAHLVSANAGIAWTVFGVLWACYLGPALIYPELMSYRISLSTGILTGVVGVASVIVESTRARAVAEAGGVRDQLERERTRVREVVTSVFPGLVDVNHRGQITYAAEGVADLAGYAVDEVIGNELADYVHPDDLALVRGALAGKSFVPALEVRLRHKEGQWVWSTFYAIPGKDRQDEIRSWTFAGHDVSEKRHAQEQLAQAQRLESIGVLAAGVAHDFNNLLTIISGFADELADGEEKSSILQATDDAAELVQNLMTFSQAGTPPEGKCELVASVQASESILRSLLGPSVELDIITVNDPHWIPFSPAQLGQVLVNLVSNAKTAMGDKGHLQIRVVSEEVRISTDKLEAGRYAKLSISDDGIGMDAETQRRAFDPFFTAKQNKLGSGLGLSSVYGIVRNAGGCVDIHSAMGRGTTVEISFPLVKPTQEQSTSPETTQVPTARSGNVMIVEDDERIATLVSRTLLDLGYQVQVRHGVEEAWRYLEQTPPDLLITDIMMPDGRGTALAQRVRNVWPEVPVLFISGYSDQQVGEWRQAQGNTRFLAKPFRGQDLRERVSQLIAV